MWSWFNMMKRRTSKRFVLGESTDVQNFDEEPVEVIPASLVQKFQMTVQTDLDEKRDKEDKSPGEDGKLLSPPKVATLQ